MRTVGIDYDTYKATLVSVDEDGRDPRLAVAQFRKASQSGDDAAIAALGAVRGRLALALVDLAIGRIDEVVFWVERGYGMSRRADWSLGAFFGAIWSELGRYDPAGLNPLDLREWKAIVTADAEVGLTKAGKGNGNAAKPIANEATRALLEREGYAAEMGWGPDALDAYAIAYAGAKLNRKAVAA